MARAGAAGPPSAMERIIETELMEDPVGAEGYAGADFKEAHSRVIELFDAVFPGIDIAGTVLDLGCGPGDVTFRLAHRFPAADLVAVDGSAAMISLARKTGMLLGSRAVPPHPGRMPMLISVVPILAEALAYSRSQASATSRPPARQWPLILQITTFSQLAMARWTSKPSWDSQLRLFWCSAKDGKISRSPPVPNPSRGAATLRLAGQLHTVRLIELAQFWRGDFASYWQAPEGYHSRLQDGSTGPAVDWLANRLNQLDGGPSAGTAAVPIALDADLRARVRAFQRTRGITPDGFVAP